LANRPRDRHSEATQGGPADGPRIPRQGRQDRGALVAAPWRSHGLATKLVPLSGAARGRFGGEVAVLLLGLEGRVQVKGRAGGVARLDGRPAGDDVLVIEADRKEPLVALFA
jgi:hypothetical protein